MQPVSTTEHTQGWPRGKKELLTCSQHYALAATELGFWLMGPDWGACISDFVSWRSEEMQSWLVSHILAGETTDGNGRCRKSPWRENGHYLEIMQSKVNILLPLYLKHSQISTQSSYYSREEMSKWSINAIYTYRKLAIDKTIFIF